MPSITASVSGSASVIVMPRPRSDLSEIRPPISWMLLRTTSMPTPRPEMSEIVSAVENPGAMMRLLTSSSVSVASGPRSPRSRAFLSTRSELIPAPSSRIWMMIRPPRCSAREMNRSLFLLAGSQSIRRQLDAMVDRVADDVRQRIAEPLDDRAVDLGRLAGHFEPDPLGVLVESSRTRRGMRWNTAPTGCARIDMTLSFSSRVW